MISQWNYQCTHQIPGKMGAYFIQFKVVRLNWLTAIENVVNLVNSSLILTPFFLQRYILDMSWDKALEVSEVFFAWQITKIRLFHLQLTTIYFFCFFWNVEMTCIFRPVVFYLSQLTPTLFLWLSHSRMSFVFFLHMALICQEASGKTASRLVPVKNGLLFVQAMSCSVKITRFAFWTAALSWV